MSDLPAAEPVVAAESQAPVASNPVTAPAEPAKRLSAAERKAALVAQLRGAKQAAVREQPAETASAEESAPGLEASEEPAEETAAPEPAKEEKPDAERDLELKLAKASRALREAKADALEFKPLADKWNSLQSRLEKAKEDPFTAVQLLPELLGMDFGKLAEHVVKNADKYKQSEKYADLDPSVREEIELARKERQERTEREAKAKQEQEQADRHAKYTSGVKELLEANSDEYPLTAALEWTAGDIALDALRQGTKNIRPLLEQMEKTLLDNLSNAVSNERILKTLVARKPELKAKLSALAAPKSDKSPAVASQKNGANRAPVEGPSTLTNRSASTDTSAEPARRKTKEERKAAIAQMFRAHNGR